MNIGKVSISGLFGRYDVELPIKNNTIILVGANGLGKTTIINIVLLALSKQWAALHRLPFQSVSIDLNGNTLFLDADALRNSASFSDAPTNALLAPPSERKPKHYVSELLSSFDREYLLNLTDPRRKFSQYRIAPSLRHYPDIDRRVEARAFLSAPANEAIVSELFGAGAIAESLKLLDSLMNHRIMHLPTYRRIEKSLQDLFPDMEEVILWEQRQNRHKLHSTQTDFVQFGMRDVSNLFSATQSKLRLHSTRVVNATSGSYLQDVIRGQGTTYDVAKIQELDDTIINRTLDRYKANEFTPDDRAAILTVTQAVKSGRQLNQNQKYIAHYLIKLIEAAQEISLVESPIRQFTKVVNEYFYDKQIAYDDSSGTLSVQYEDIGDEGQEEEIRLADLSSGEKQIVSLFSHVFLETRSSLIFIDEPELSLSVEWQTKLLPDLLASGRCSFLFSATHSPFVFDNALEPHTVDLRSVLKVRT